LFFSKIKILLVELTDTSEEESAAMKEYNQWY